MEKTKNPVEVSEGALAIVSKIPVGDSRSSKKAASAWVPQITIAIPEKEKPFLVGENYISQKGTEYYIKNDNGGMTIWHSHPEILKSLKARSYIFGLEKRDAFFVYSFKNSFIPDANDKNQERADINLLAANEGFSYAESLRKFTAIYPTGCIFPNFRVLLSRLNGSSIGYECVHEGDIGLNSTLNGKIELSEEQIEEAFPLIRENLESLIS